MTTLPPFSWGSLATTWDVPVLAAVVLVLAAAAYLAGVLRVHDWRGRDTLWFYWGLLVCAIALCSGVNAYSDVLFSVHMAQHLLLIMVAPTLLLLGRPVELWRRVSSGRAHRGTARIARSLPVRVLTHPVFAFLCYAAVVAGTHLTPFQQVAATRGWAHDLEELLYLGSGYLFLLPIVGSEPLGRRLPHLLRLVTLLVGMVVDTVVGVALLMSTRMPFAAYADPGRGWGPSPLDDLHWGGAMMWVGGDLLMAALAILVIATWVTSPGGAELGSWLESARRSAVTGGGEPLPRNANLDEDDAALDAYNAMLARLSRENHRHPR